ncbi:hypothetical protein ACG04R_16335 [Roseateles sp. BYS78W]|uniref:Uncharacterized protein n=1 Tax=Pelomonas candidula TaxID=3299025 RepID=A0ABW7HEA5_9BURK
MNVQTANYALDRVKALRAANAVMYEHGLCTQVERQTLQEVDRLQEMNQSLVNARRPEKDLVKDIPGYQVPPVTDPVIKGIIASHVAEKDR